MEALIDKYFPGFDENMTEEEQKKNGTAEDGSIVGTCIL